MFLNCDVLNYICDICHPLGDSLLTRFEKIGIGKSFNSKINKLTIGIRWFFNYSLGSNLTKRKNRQGGKFVVEFPRELKSSSSSKFNESVNSENAIQRFTNSRG